MWPFTRTKHVVLVVHQGGTHYLAEDLKLTSDVADALGFPSALDAMHASHKLANRGVRAMHASIVTRR